MIAIVIPTLNEERTIGKVLDAMPKTIGKEKISIFVVDGLSTDKTVAIAKKKKAKIILEKRKGKGLAIRTAFNYLKRMKKISYVVMLDGDFTYHPKYIPKIINALKENDVVFAFRLHDSKNMRLTHSLGNKFITALALILYRHYIKDLCTGYIGFRKEALDKLNLVANGFDLEADIYSEACTKKMHIGNIPIRYQKSLSSSKLKTRDGFRIVTRLVRNKLRHF